MRSRRGLRTMFAGVTAGVLAGAVVAAAPPAQAGENGGTLKVMTQNLYLGADLFPAVEAASQGTGEFLLAAAKVYQEAMASDFPARAAAMAKTVKQQRPDIIGVQEVTQWFATRYTSTGAELPTADFLKILKKALAAEGLKYKVLGVSENASLGPFPYIDPAMNCGQPGGTLPTSWPCAIQMKDRDVILVNTQTKGLTYQKKSVKSGQFKAQQQFTVAGTTVSFSRGYVYADMTYGGAKFRFANTHLEVGGESAGIQHKQGKQFIKIVQKGASTVIATGDFNTDAYGTYSPKTYRTLTKSYFADSWNKKKDGTGFTCCQNALLSNPASENNSRIDLILTHGKVKAKGGRTTNDTPFRQAPPPLWESDHAGVVTKLKVS